MQGHIIKTIGLVLIALIVVPIIGMGLFFIAMMILVIGAKYGALVGVILAIIFLAVLWVIFVAILKFAMTAVGIEK